MIAKFDLKGVHTNIDEGLQKYATKKLATLDKYLPKHHRESVHAVVELKQSAKVQDHAKYTCAVQLHLPKGTINVSESTMNMYAAIDIVETKLKQQIKRYKESHTDGRMFRRLGARFKRGDRSEVLDLEPEV